MNVDREKIGKVDDKLLDVLQLDMELLHKLKNNIDILAYDNKISSHHKRVSFNSNIYKG